MLEHNRFKKARINIDALETASPKVASVIARMLLNGVPAKRARRYIRAHVEEAVMRKIIRPKYDPKKIKAIKKRLNVTELDRTNKSVKKAANKAAKLSFKLPKLGVVSSRYKKLFGTMSKTNHDLIYRPIIHTWHTIRHMFASAEFYRSYNRQPNIETAAIFANWRDSDMLKAIDESDNFLKDEVTHLITRVNRLPLHGFRVRVSSTQKEPELMENTRAAVRIIQTFFKNYKLPTEYDTVDLNEMEPAEKALMGLEGWSTNQMVLFKEQILKQRYTFAQLKALRPIYTHYDEKKWAAGPDNIQMPTQKALGRKAPVPTSVEKMLDEMLEFELRLVPRPQDVNNENRQAARATKGSGQIGDINTPILILAYELQCTAYIKWPRELAYYATFSDNEDEFIHAFFLRYTTLHRNFSARANQNTGGFKPPHRIQPLSKIKKLIDKESKTRKIKPRTNEDGFIIVGPSENKYSGSIIYVPPANVNKVEDYIRSYRDAYDKDSSEIKFDKTLMLRNTPILSDWSNSIFTFANAGDSDYLTRGVTSINLTGAVPLDDTTIARDLERTIIEDLPNFKRFTALLTSFTEEKGLGDTGTALASDDDDSDYDDDKPRLLFSSDDKSFPTLIEADGIRERFDIDNEEHTELLVEANLKSLPREIQSVLENNRIFTVNAAASRLEMSPVDVSWGDIGAPSNDIKETPVVEAACHFLRVQCERMLKHFDSLSSAYSERVLFQRYYLMLITKYAKKRPDYKKIYNTAIAANKAIGLDLLKPVPVINMPGMTKLLPHQVKSVNRLIQKDTNNAIVSVQAGGGKTGLEILDVMQQLYTGKVQHALIVPPNGLVQNWVDEINKMSKGMINAVPLTTAVLRDMERIYSGLHKNNTINTPDYENLGRFLLSAPKNTLFIASTNFLSSHKEIQVYGDRMITRFYMAEFLRDLFDAPNKLLACVDESHFVKNITSARTKATAVLFTAAKMKRLMSGTVIFDKLDDLIGQTSLINPATLGNELAFTRRYKDPESTSLFLPDAPQRILEDTTVFMQNIRHKRREWAFILPTLIERFHTAQLTPKQLTYYDMVVRKAFDEILSDSKLMEMLKQEDESKEAAVLSGLGSHLSKIESFIYAPDAHRLAKKYPKITSDDEGGDSQFALQVAFEKTAGVTAEDLISPKVAVIDSIITKHLRGYTDDEGNKIPPDESKIIVFSYRKVNSAHFYEHSKHKKVCSYYSAGDDAALTRFLTDDNCRVLVADETSINTGRNFQLAARIIRTETLWTPGGQEQAIARIWRPDFDDLDLKKRPFVYMDWVYCVPSFECLKIARLVSKMIDMKKYDEGDNPAFVTKPAGKLPDGVVNTIRRLGIYFDSSVPINDQISSMRAVKLSARNLQDIRRPEQVAEYFGYYAMIQNWEAREFEEAKADPKNKVHIISPQQRKELTGSRKMPFVPRVPGQKPLDPDNKYGFKIIAILKQKEKEDGDEDEFEDDDGEDSNAGSENDPAVQDLIEVKRGQVVDTQWGFGRIGTVLKNSLRVIIPGFKEPVKVHKTCAYVLTNEKAEKRILGKLKKNGLKYRFPEGVDGQLALGRPDKHTKFEDKDNEIPKFRPSRRINEEYEDDDETETVTRFGKDKIDVTDANQKIELTPVIVDKQIALLAYDADDDAEILKTHHGFKNLNEYIAVHVKTPIAFDRVLQKLQKDFKIHEKYIQGLEDYRSALVKKRLDSFDPHNYSDAHRFFAFEQHRKIKVGVLRPYPIIWNNGLYIAFDKASQPSAVRIKSKLAGIPNVRIYNEPSSYINIYRSVGAAISALKEIKETIKVTNYADTLESLRSAKSLNLRRG